MKTLKGQILLIVVCMTLLSACVCGTVSIINSYSVTRADMYSILTEDSIAHAQKIDITLAQIETSVNTLATIAENTIDDIENFSSGNEAVDEYTSKLQDAAIQKEPLPITFGTTLNWHMQHPAFLPPGTILQRTLSA